MSETKWTPELVKNLKECCVPFGLLDAGLAKAMKEACKIGAEVEYYDHHGLWSRSSISYGPLWAKELAYRVHASWQPPEPHPSLEVERCEVFGPNRSYGFLHYRRAGVVHSLGNAVNSQHFIAYKYGDGTLSCESRRLRVSPLANLPSFAGSLAFAATFPVAVLFVRRPR